jgi:hypothetical protein
VNRFADSRIRAASANIAGHRRIDIGIAGLWIRLEKRRRGHDLSGLTVTAWLRSKDSPSIVVMDLPCTALTGSTQERVAWPSMCTVQAPHSAMPQPNLVPVIPR